MLGVEARNGFIVPFCYQKHSSNNKCFQTKRPRYRFKESNLQAMASHKHWEIREPSGPRQSVTRIPHCALGMMECFRCEQVGETPFNFGKPRMFWTSFRSNMYPFCPAPRPNDFSVNQKSDLEWESSEEERIDLGNYWWHNFWNWECLKGDTECCSRFEQEVGRYEVELRFLTWPDTVFTSATYI